MKNRIGIFTYVRGENMFLILLLPLSPSPHPPPPPQTRPSSQIVTDALPVTQVEGGRAFNGMKERASIGLHLHV